MKLILTPQRNDAETLYSVEGDELTATVNGKTDIFDFTGMPDGTAEDFETDLDFNPVVSAQKVDGVLTVKVINAYGPEPIRNEQTTDEDWQKIIANYEKQKTEYEVKE